MTIRTLVFIVIAAAAIGTSVEGQTGDRAPAQPRPPQTAIQPEAPQPPTPPTPPPPPPPPGRSAPRPGQAVNVKIELTITDQRSGPAPVTRTLSLVVADGQRGMVRSASDVVGIGLGLPLNVDASPTLLAGGKVRLFFTLQIDSPGTFDQQPPNAAPARGTVVKTSINESVTLVLEDGKAIVATQSADPISDRKVSVEVKATILR